LPELSLLRQLFAINGSSAYGSFPFFSFNATKVNLSGNFAHSLNLDLSGGMSDLGGVNNFRIFISQDDGLTESSQVYQNSIFKTVNTVDATGLTSTVKTFSFSTAPSGMTVLAPNVPSILKSGGGNNVLTGGSSNDTLIAGSGVDILNGGLGNDTLVAGLNTTMTGGSGNDTFVFPSITTLVSGRSSIVISDFGNGADVLNLAPVVGNQGTTKAATAIVGSSARGTGFVNTAGAVDQSVFLVYNTGLWVDVTPQKGAALFFRHGFGPGSVLHQGCRVSGDVSKYVARINVMYARF
jgi:Ca2+-binding RTX toxin-like protein